MAKIKFDMATMSTITLFENVTHARCKDCIIGPDSVLFIVQENQIAKAIGRKGQHIKHLEAKLKKKVKVVEFSPDVVRFIKNLCTPAAIAEAEEADGIITLRAADSRSRGMLIGREANILRANEAIVKRHFPITEIKVL